MFVPSLIVPCGVLGNYLRSLSLGSELYFRWLGGLADVARPFRRVVRPFWGAVVDPSFLATAWGGTPFRVCAAGIPSSCCLQLVLVNRFRVVFGLLRPT